MEMARVNCGLARKICKFRIHENRSGNRRSPRSMAIPSVFSKVSSYILTVHQLKSTLLTVTP